LDLEYIYGSDTGKEGFEKTNRNFSTVASTATAALPATDFTGANVLTKLAADNSVLPVKNGGTGAAESLTACSNLGITQMFSNPNLLINDFQVAQRGTDITTTVGYQYTLDRWCCQYINTRATRLNNTSPAPCLYSYQVINNYTSAQNILLLQALENYKSLAGKTLTASGWIRGVGGYTGTYYMRIGTNGSLVLNLTSEWQYFSITKENVSFSDTDIRSQGIVFYGGSVNFPSAGQGIEIAGVKLELGSVATPFVPRPYGEELALCQRYYIKFGTYYGTSASTTYSEVTNSATIYINIPVALMRISPTILYNSGNTNNYIVFSGTYKHITGITVSSVNGGTIRCTVSFDGTIPACTLYSVLIIDLAFDAEIY
jgi:hypothetical protein